MNVVIVGGGISGISAAKVVLREGHSATILEEAPEPGGLMARIANCRVGFKSFYDEIGGHPRLTVIREGRIASAERKGKSFSLALENGRVVDADRVVIAAGLAPYDPVEYKGKRVLTSLEYDALIDQRNNALPSDFNRIAFVLCVGSRSAEYPLCSSVCCSYTLREIKWTLQRAEAGITVFYNDLRFFGQEFFLERLFREGGVRFIRANSRYFDEDDEGVTLRFFAEGKLKEERFDYVVLAIGLRPNPGLRSLSRLFGFSLNSYGFVREEAPLTTDAEHVYASGGALEPMSIKDAILTGFGAGVLASREAGHTRACLESMEKLYREKEPEIELPQGVLASCLFYLDWPEPSSAIFYEYISTRFVAMARELKNAGKDVYVVTRNMVTPSYGEVLYEEARREGVIFIHLEEHEQAAFEEGRAIISSRERTFVLPADRVVRAEDYTESFRDRDFLSLYRSEPQLRWSPTKWDRTRYHVGFIRHPRAERWEPREALGALGEMLLDAEEERMLPEVNEERCSGCGSCRDACPHGAMELEIRERTLALFGSETSSGVPVARVVEEKCMGCGLCVSTCPSNVITCAEPLVAP